MREQGVHSLFAAIKKVKYAGRKMQLFCNLEERAVITARDVASIYEVPVAFAQEGVDSLALKYLHIDTPEPDLSKWKSLVQRCYNPQDEVSIAIVGKYVSQTPRGPGG